MKCRFLVDVKIMNPAWSQKDANAAADAKVPYNVPQQFEVSAGYQVEDPQAWIHCCPGDLNSAPIAEPADEECAAAVKEWMEVKRPAAIQQIKAQLDQIEFIKHPEDKQRLLAMGKAYGLIGASAEKKSKKAETPA